VAHRPGQLALRCALAVSFCVALASFALSQTQAPPPVSKDQIRVVTNEVIAAVTVVDRSGEFVLDLSQKDFRVFDDGVEQTIEHWDLGGDPLAIVLVLETSSRIRALAPVIHSLGSIFTETAMALNGEAAVITYDSTVEVRQPFTQDHDAVEEAIAKVEFEVPTRNLYDAMAQAVKMLEDQASTERRVMLIIGESQDEGSKAKLGDITREAAQANISIYSIGPSSVGADYRSKNGVAPLKLSKLPPISPASSCVDILGHPCIVDLMTSAMALLERGTNEIKNHQLEVAAAATGGVHYRAFRDSTIRSALDKIGGEIHAQYVIGYRPTSERAPGFHSIKVTVSLPDVSVRTRPGYYVAPPTN
jgi:VWFA-related protein